MKGSRSSHNCYKFLQPHTCKNTSIDKIEIWNQRLGHLNYKNQTKIVNVGIVHGLPKLGKKEPRVCGSCELGKQLKGTHKMLQ